MPIDILGATIAGSNNVGVSITANGVTGLTINPSSFATLGNRPYFIAQGTASWTAHTANNWSNVVLNYEIVDNGGNYNTSTGAFTAPVSGTYYFEASTYTQKSPSTNADSYTHPLFRINDSYTYRQSSATTPYRLKSRTNASSSYSTDTQINDIFYLAAGDYVHFHIYSGGSLQYYPPYSLFSGFLIG